VKKAILWRDEAKRKMLPNRNVLGCDNVGDLLRAHPVLNTPALFFVDEIVLTMNHAAQ